MIPSGIPDADATHHGLMSVADFTKLAALDSAAIAAAIAASHPAVTIGTANGLSVNGSQVLSLAAADGSNAGALSAAAQSIGGPKTFNALTTLTGALVQTNALRVTGAPSGLTAGMDSYLGSYNGSSASALWLHTTSPNASNFSVMAYVGGGLFLNAPPNNTISFSHNGSSIGTLTSTGVFTIGTLGMNNAGNVTFYKPSAPMFFYAAGSSGVTETIRLVGQRGDSGLKCVVAGTESASPNADAVLFQVAKGVVTTLNDTGNGTPVGLQVMGDGRLRALSLLQLNGDGTARPSADSAVRGTLWYSKSAGGVADTLEVCLKSAADTYSWVTLATG